MNFDFSFTFYNGTKYERKCPDLLIGDKYYSASERLRVGDRRSGMDKGQYSVCGDYAAKLMSSNFFYLLLTPSIYKASGACES